MRSNLLFRTPRSLAFLGGALFLGFFLLEPRAQQLRIIDINFDETRRTRITHQADTNAYFVLQRGSILSDLSHSRDARLGVGETGELIDAMPLAGHAFYR